MTVINVRKWFEKTNGNTYHTVRVIQSGAGKDRRDLISTIQYGYESVYLQTVAELLLATHDTLMASMRIRPEDYYTDIVEVSRKSDLHKIQ